MAVDTSRLVRTLRELRGLYLPFAERHYRRKHRNEPTREHLNMRAAIDHFIAHFGEDFDPHKLRHFTINAWLDQLLVQGQDADDQRRALSLDYVNSVLARVRRWLKWAIEEDFVEYGIMRELGRVKARKRGGKPPVTKRPPSLEQIAAVMPHLPRVPRDVLQLSKLTGARPSELLEAFNGEVHNDQYGARLQPLQHKCAHHERSPSRHRVIPLSPEALRIVERYWRPFLPGERLFASKSKHGHFTIEGLRGAVSRACKRAGIPAFELYDVRRRVARHVRKERGLDAAQALLGHAHSRTTEIYAPLEPGESETVAAARRAQEVL